MFLGILGIFALPAVSDIPPTPAFSQIIIADQNITASSYRSSFEVTTMGNLSASISNNTIILNLESFSCPELESITGVDSDGNWICG